MNAATLVENLYELDKTLTETIVAFKLKCCLDKKREEQNEAKRALMEETKLLHARTLCIICGIRKRTELALPCTHLKVCVLCRTETCALRRLPVNEYIHVYMQ